MNATNRKIEPSNRTIKEVYTALTMRNKGQLSYLWGLERFETANSGYRLDVSCDCGEKEIFTSCKDACFFVFNHAGHEIWIGTTKRRWKAQKGARK